MCTFKLKYLALFAFITFFSPLTLTAQQNVSPCKSNPEFRKFDFWIGEWHVYQQEKLAGTNIIQLILDDCVILENWTGNSGYTGKSFNIYNANTKQWEQLWVDNTGGVLKLSGGFENGVLKYTGATKQADGTTISELLTFERVANGEIRQLWRQSTDNGKSWKTVFDGLYRRKK